VLFGEPDGPAVSGRVAQARLVAPSLLRFEFANACVKKFRRHPDLRVRLDELLHAVADLAIETMAIETAAAVHLAEATGLSAYDASYFWLARSLGAELVTLDVKLAKAAAEPVSPKR
jgi:predicted nucleic acid-binding protein